MSIIKDKNTKPNYQTDSTGYTYTQLWKFAKERKIKYFRRYSKNDLERMLGLEISKPNEKHEKYCREKMRKPIPVIAINRVTDEILNFKSISSASKNFNMNPESIK